MSDILLLHPYSGSMKRYQIGPHLGLLSIGTVLKKAGYSIKVMNIFQDKSSFNELMLELNKKDTMFVGISAMTPQVGFALELTNFIKEYNQNLPIVWGGVHATLFPEQTIDNPLIDIVVIGEGEYACLDIANNIRNGGDFKSINGIYFKEGNKIFKTPLGPYIDINDLPPLDYDLVNVEDFIWQDFSDFNGPKKCRALNIVSSRGCPYKCTFCINGIVLKNGFRYKRADFILDEMEYLVKKYNINHVAFRDEEFFVSKKRLIEILDGMENRGLGVTWHAEVRANHFKDNYIDLELAKRIKKLGCFWLSIGVESSSDRILKKIKKGITLDQVDRAYDICLKAGITLSSGFIIGLPTETKEETFNTIKYIYEKWRINPKMRPIIVSIFRPYPGSVLYDEVLKLGYTENKGLEDWCKEDFYDTNYQNLSDYPWIEDLDYIKIVNFTWRNVFASYKRAFDWLQWNKIFMIIGIIRIKYNLWGFPIEMVIFNFVRRIISLYRYKKERIISRRVKIFLPYKKIVDSDKLELVT